MSTTPPANFHFVRDYQKMVSDLLAQFPVDGNFERFGAIEGAVLYWAGLCDGMSPVDFGCGSGRLAWVLGKLSIKLDYLGIDIDQRLLDYAKTKSPPHFRFALSHALSVPAPDTSADMTCAFSVFTHLRHTETFLYLRDMHRVLRPDGTSVFSFLEFAPPAHWKTFIGTAASELHGGAPHPNQLIERNTVNVWCEKLGYERVSFIDSTAAPWGEPGALGQSTAILRRR